MTAGLVSFASAARLKVAPAAMLVLASCFPALSAPPAPHADVARPADLPAVRNPEADPASRNVVARARMLECGHQWSSLKRAGTASGTWKDFSRGCLAQR